MRIPLFIAGLWLSPLALSAQGPPLQVNAIRNLAFGAVILGIPTRVAPADPVKSGEFEFITAIGNTVRVQFTLPTRLNGPAGARMPISFGATDAIATGTAPSSVPVTFDPRSAQNFRIVSSNRILVFIGGTVSPAANQRTGTYSGTIRLTVTIL
jgi:hypothetical protein